eukprot:1533083-Amphidinium_carterae.1
MENNQVRFCSPATTQFADLDAQLAYPANRATPTSGKLQRKSPRRMKAEYQERKQEHQKTVQQSHQLGMMKTCSKEEE